MSEFRSAWTNVRATCRSFCADNVQDRVDFSARAKKQDSKSLAGRLSFFFFKGWVPMHNRETVNAEKFHLRFSKFPTVVVCVFAAVLDMSLAIHLPLCGHILSGIDAKHWEWVRGMGSFSHTSVESCAAGNFAVLISFDVGSFRVRMDLTRCIALTARRHSSSFLDGRMIEQSYKRKEETTDRFKHRS